MTAPQQPKGFPVGSRVRIRCASSEWDGMLCEVVAGIGLVARLRPLEEDRPDGGTDPVYCRLEFLIPAEDEMNLEEI